MAWRFRKSFSPLPGVRLTLSPSGISTSVGAGPFRLRVGPGGPSLTASMLGTCLSFRQAGTGQTVIGSSSDSISPVHIVPTSPLVRELESIESAGSGALTTPGLAEFKHLLEQARRENGEIARDLLHWRAQEGIAVSKYQRWASGWVLRHLFTSKFRALSIAAEEASARRTELEEQEQLSKLQTQLELPRSVTHAFHRLTDEFALLSRAQRVWDTVGQRNANQVAERTTASRIVERKLVKFGLGKCELIDCEWKVPHLENANGGDIYFYPAFALYFVTPESFALLEYKEVETSFSSTRFIEEESVPSDTKVVGTTWAKANKDGSPDRRFNGNHQIPIAEYGKLLIKSATGMNEEYMISDVERTEAFVNAWKSLASAVNSGV